jgi:RNA polymerase sigma-70 factor, ECF subfamily
MLQRPSQGDYPGASTHPSRPLTSTSTEAAVEAAVSHPIDPLIGLAVSGNLSAAHDLLAGILPRVANLVRYLIGRDIEIEDVCQRVLVEVLNSLHTYRGESKFSTWTDRITVRTTLAYVRRRRVSAARLREITADATVSRALECSDDPELHVIRREAMRVLDDLPKDQRIALVLHYMVGLSVPEISARTAVPFETVRSRLRIGMHKLRKHFGVIEDGL